MSKQNKNAILISNWGEFFVSSRQIGTIRRKSKQVLSTNAGNSRDEHKHEVKIDFSHLLERSDLTVYSFKPPRKTAYPVRVLKGVNLPSKMKSLNRGEERWITIKLFCFLLEVRAIVCHLGTNQEFHAYILARNTRQASFPPGSIEAGASQLNGKLASGSTTQSEQFRKIHAIDIINNLLEVFKYLGFHSECHLSVGTKTLSRKSAQKVAGKLCKIWAILHQQRSLWACSITCIPNRKKQVASSAGKAADFYFSGLIFFMWHWNLVPDAKTKKYFGGPVAQKILDNLKQYYDKCLSGPPLEVLRARGHAATNVVLTKKQI